MAMTQRQVFIMFLKKHQAYSAFRRNLDSFAGVTTLNEMILMKQPYFFIVHGFTWPPHTNQEPDWVVLHRKWTILVADLNINNLRKM